MQPSGSQYGIMTRMREPDSVYADNPNLPRKDFMMSLVGMEQSLLLSIKKLKVTGLRE